MFKCLALDKDKNFGAELLTLVNITNQNELGC